MCNPCVKLTPVLNINEIVDVNNTSDTRNIANSNTSGNIPNPIYELPKNVLKFRDT